MMKNKRLQLNIDGLDCADCAVQLEKNISKLPGINHARIDFMAAKLNVEFDESVNDLNDIKTVIAKSGYSVKNKATIQQSTLIVNGMDCADEARPIEKRLKKMSGINSIKFNLITNKLIIKHSIPLKDIQRVLKELGFESEIDGQIKNQAPQSFWQKHKETAHVKI